MDNGYYVYRFKDKNNKIIYVGKTINLDNRFKQHEHLTEDVKTIEYIECASESDMAWKEIYYINLFKNDKTTNTASVYHDKPTKIDFGDKWIKYKFPEKKYTLDYKRQRGVYHNKYMNNVENPDAMTIITVSSEESEDYFFDGVVSEYNRKTGGIKLDVYLSEAQLFYNPEAYHICDKLNNSYYIDKETGEPHRKFEGFIFSIENFEKYRRLHSGQDYLLNEQNLKNDIMKQHDDEYEREYGKYWREIEKQCKYATVITPEGEEQIYSVENGEFKFVKSNGSIYDKL